MREKLRLRALGHGGGFLCGVLLPVPFPKLWLAAEWMAIFLVLPLVVAIEPTRAHVLLSLWAVTTGAAVYLTRQPDFSWRALWRGQGLARRQRTLILARFVLSTLAVIILTLIIMPGRLFSFPMTPISSQSNI